MVDACLTTNGHTKRHRTIGPGRALPGQVTIPALVLICNEVLDCFMIWQVTGQALSGTRPRRDAARVWYLSAHTHNPATLPSMHPSMSYYSLTPSHKTSPPVQPPIIRLYYFYVQPSACTISLCGLSPLQLSQQSACAISCACECMCVRVCKRV